MIGIDQSQQCPAHGFTVDVQVGSLLFDRGYMVHVEGVVGLWGCLGSLSGVSQGCRPCASPQSTLEGPGGPAITTTVHCNYIEIDGRDFDIEMHGQKNIGPVRRVKDEHVERTRSRTARTPETSNRSGLSQYAVKRNLAQNVYYIPIRTLYPLIPAACVSH